MRAGRAALAVVACVLSGALHADDRVTFSAGQRFDQRDGDALYRSICQGCHMPDGRGATGAGTYPALVVNARLANAAYPIAIVLNGNGNMPAFAHSLDDAQIAEVVGYVRTRFGNRHDDPVTAAQVAALRVPP